MVARADFRVAEDQVSQGREDARVARFDHVLLCWFRNRQASLPGSDGNRWERKPQALGHSAQQPSTWCGRSEQLSLDQVGCEARKIPAEGEVFFLDFYLYRTYRNLALFRSDFRLTC